MTDKIGAYIFVDSSIYREHKEHILRNLRYKILQEYNEKPLSILYAEPRWETEVVTETLMENYNRDDLKVVMEVNIR